MEPKSQAARRRKSVSSYNREREKEKDGEKQSNASRRRSLAHSLTRSLAGSHRKCFASASLCREKPARNIEHRIKSNACRRFGFQPSSAGRDEPMRQPPVRLLVKLCYLFYENRSLRTAAPTTLGPFVGQRYNLYFYQGVLASATSCNNVPALLTNTFSCRLNTAVFTVQGREGE